MDNENKDIIVKENSANNSQKKQSLPGGKKKMNLPNRLTVFRLALIPAVMFFIYYPVINEVWSRIFAASLFLIASLTDLLDGILARRLNMVTNFGKVMDPLADKVMVIGALIALTASEMFAGIRFILIWVTAIIFLRELAVTSVRLVASEADGIVIPANFAGKLKTFSQVVCIMTVLLEKIVIKETLNIADNVFSIIMLIITTLLTLYSGLTYFKAYWKYIDPTK